MILKITCTKLYKGLEYRIFRITNYLESDNPYILNDNLWCRSPRSFYICVCVCVSLSKLGLYYAYLFINFF